MYLLVCVFSNKLSTSVQSQILLKTYGKVCNVSVTHSYMLDNELLDPYQSAYKPQHGTETALLKVRNGILCALSLGHKGSYESPSSYEFRRS